MLKDVALAATVGVEAAFMVGVAVAFTVGAVASTVAAAAFTVAVSVPVVAFTAMAPVASAEVTAGFGEASPVTVGDMAATAEATGGMAGAGDEAGAEAGDEVGVGVDSVGPTSDLAGDIPGPIGPDRTLAMTTTLTTTDAIPTVPTLAIRTATEHMVATRIPTVPM